MKNLWNKKFFKIEQNVDSVTGSNQNFLATEDFFNRGKKVKIKHFKAKRLIKRD